MDGLMIGITKKAGAGVINDDRMWHYVEGVKNWNPIWPEHGSSRPYSVAAASRSSTMAATIAHSDRSSQYTAGDYRHTLDLMRMTQSMSRTAHCYDNATMEIF